MQRVQAARRAQAPADAGRAVLGWADGFALTDTKPAIVIKAITLVAAHRLGFRDGVMLAGAAQANCRALLLADMQDGFSRRGVTIRNPFDATGDWRA